MSEVATKEKYGNWTPPRADSGMMLQGMAVSLIRRGWLGGVTLAHSRGGDEPRLWLPDQILGAQGHVDAKGGARDDWAREWRRLEKRVERREISP